MDTSTAIHQYAMAEADETELLQRPDGECMVVLPYRPVRDREDAQIRVEDGQYILTFGAERISLAQYQDVISKIKSAAILVMEIHRETSAFRAIKARIV